MTGLTCWGASRSGASSSSWSCWGRPRPDTRPPPGLRTGNPVTDWEPEFPEQLEQRTIYCEAVATRETTHSWRWDWSSCWRWAARRSWRCRGRPPSGPGSPWRWSGSPPRTSCRRACPWPGSWWCSRRPRASRWSSGWGDPRPCTPGSRSPPPGPRRPCWSWDSQSPGRHWRPDIHSAASSALCLSDTCSSPGQTPAQSGGAASKSEIILHVWSCSQETLRIHYLVVLMADGDPGVVGDDSLVQRQNSLVPRLQPPNLKTRY